jgi:hypothetical protein
MIRRARLPTIFSGAMDASWKDTQPRDVEGSPLDFTVFSSQDDAKVIGAVKTYKLSITNKKSDQGFGMTLGDWVVLALKVES